MISLIEDRIPGGKLLLPKKQVPKRLDRGRSMFYELPSYVGEVELNHYELKYRTNEKEVFRQRIGHRFFFEFTSASERNKYMNDLERTNVDLGFAVQRVIIYTT